MDTAGKTSRWKRGAWRLLGSVSVAIGIINAFIPLLPTTVFLIIGAWAWSKGAPEWHARLLAHPRFGPPLRHWADGRRLTRTGKWMSSLGMAAGFTLTVILVGLRPVTLLVGAGLLLLSGWLWLRPEPQVQRLSGRPSAHVAERPDLRLPSA